ncbi:MAG: thiol:disulfide interchange protein [Candidatus Endobugula sp.]|jgi:thiol:disulfide interchange protein
MKNRRSLLSRSTLGHLLLLLFCMSFSSVSPALDDSSLLSSSNPFAAQPFPSKEDAFLSVDEAYQLSIRQTDTHIMAEWVIADTYFLYGEQFAFSVDGKVVDALLPAGKVSYDEIFEKQVEKHYLYVQAIIEKASLTAANTIHLSVRSQGCADAGLCYPPEIKAFTIDLTQTATQAVMATTAQAPQQTHSALSLNSTSNTIPNTAPNTSKTSILLTLFMLLCAVLGGALLNLMPCVFPVLSIKVLSLSNNNDRRARIRHAWSYTLGCLTTFLLIAGLLLFVRSAGKSIGWGFQLQEPSVITFLALLFFVMGLSLSGLVNFGARWMGTGQNLTQGKGLIQSFFTGVLAAVVASPCTAPFMATALGYALTQTTFIALSIFGALGLGMALPFLLLSYLPQLGRLLPSPGAWMATFKQILAYPLYLTSTWLLWVLGRQIGNDAVILVIYTAILIAFILWLNSKYSHTSKKLWLLAGNASIIILVGSIIWHNKQQDRISQPPSKFWQTYTTAKLANLRRDGSAVFVNLTADWCITCKINEKVVFTPATLELMKNKRIHLLQGDWTNYNAEITELLDRYGRGGVPLYLLFPAESGADATLLPQIINPISFKRLISDF